MAPELPTFYARDRRAWRRWLERNHDRERGVWLMRMKARTGKPCVTYEDSVLEALCFGWIDGQMKHVDDEHNLQRFTPRKPRSGWAASNKRRVEALIAQGLMTPAGMAAVEEAKRTGAWALLDAVEAMQMPDDFTVALRRNKRAARNFDAFSPSAKKMYLSWVLGAKRPDTRAKRIAASVRYASANRTLLDAIERDRAARD